MIQPAVIIADKLYEDSVMYVAAEGRIICNITSMKIAVALVTLMATYYIYNVEHYVGKNVFYFLALALMGIVPTKCPVSVKSIVGVLSNL